MVASVTVPRQISVGASPHGKTEAPANRLKRTEDTCLGAFFVLEKWEILEIRCRYPGSEPEVNPQRDGGCRCKDVGNICDK